MRDLKPPKFATPAITPHGWMLCVFSLALFISLRTGATPQQPTNDPDTKPRIHSANGAVRVNAGRAVGDVESGNGRITLQSEVTANHVRSVNGRITIADGVTVNSVQANNGAITIGEQFYASGTVATDNGNITIGTGSEIGGKVISSNGAISLNNTVVVQGIENRRGSVSIVGASQVQGDIHLRPSTSNHHSSDIEHLYISADALVGGKIIVERPLQLDIENPALRKKVIMNIADQAELSDAKPGERRHAQ